MDDSSEHISNDLLLLEEHFSMLAKKLIFLRNENVALKKRIELLERENELLKSKRDFTVAKLKSLMDKFSDAEI